VSDEDPESPPAAQTTGREDDWRGGLRPEAIPARRTRAARVDETEDDIDTETCLLGRPDGAETAAVGRAASDRKCIDSEGMRVTDDETKTGSCGERCDDATTRLWRTERAIAYIF